MKTPRVFVRQPARSTQFRRVSRDKAVQNTHHILRKSAASMPVDFVKALLNHNDKVVTGIYARWHVFEEKREAVMAIEAAVLPLSPSPGLTAGTLAAQSTSGGIHNDMAS